MAKGYNPADAHRKAQKAKEKKRNKEHRKEAKVLTDVKKGTGAIESEIKDLSSKERSGKLTSTEKADLDTARAELARLRKIKEDYVAKNPEQRSAVYGQDRSADGGKGEKSEDLGPGITGPGINIPARQLRDAIAQGLRFDKKGRLLNPEKSVYYDAVFNPYGVPPPGMPYQARPPTAEELAALQAEQESSDDDIVMPEGPKPGEEDSGGDEDSDDEESDDDDEDDIPMPEGPPPPKIPVTTAPQAPTPLPTALSIPQGSAIRMAPSQPPLPSGFLPPQPHHVPKPLFGRPPVPAPSVQSRPPHTLPQRPTANVSTAPNLHALPARPHIPALASEDPPKRADLTPEELAKLRASATISAAPQVRDFKKETTTFLPQTLKRKRPPAAASVPAKKAATAVEPRVAEELRATASKMHLPPGFALGPTTKPSDTRSAQPHLPSDFGSQDAVESQGLSHGASNGISNTLPSSYEDEDDEVSGPSIGPTRPGAGLSHTLPGYDDDDDDEPEFMPARPPAHFQSSLPGFDDEEDEEADNEPIPMRPPSDFKSSLPGFDDDDDGVEKGELEYRASTGQETYVEDDDVVKH